MDNYTLTRYPYVIAAICLLSLSAGGCVDTRVAEQHSSMVMAQNVLLQKEKDNLQAELEEKNVLLARLQMELGRKEEEISQLKSMNRQGPAKEIAGIAIRTPAASTKVETVAYLAEISTEIAAFKESDRPEDLEIFEKADKLIKESNSELDQGRFDQASLLAAQAMELISKQRLDNPVGRQRQSRPYADFVTPLELKVAKRSNIRIAPGTGSQLLITVNAGTGVTAIGHKGSWIKVVLADGREGWMYHSLLLLPEGPKIRKDDRATPPRTREQ